VSFDDHDEIAAGTSINVIDACYANETNWEPESPTQFERFTNCGILRVERMRPDSWAAYRDDCELRNCRHQQVIFSTRQQAQRAADMHAGDRYPNYRADGGVHWYEQSNSHYVPRVARQSRAVGVRSSDDPITHGERTMNDEVKTILSRPTADVPTVGRVFFGLGELPVRKLKGDMT
jgi:hypothetical protein